MDSEFSLPSITDEQLWGLCDVFTRIGLDISIEPEMDVLVELKNNETGRTAKIISSCSNAINNILMFYDCIVEVNYDENYIHIITGCHEFKIYTKKII